MSSTVYPSLTITCLVEARVGPPCPDTGDRGELDIVSLDLTGPSGRIKVSPSLETALTNALHEEIMVAVAAELDDATASRWERDV